MSYREFGTYGLRFENCMREHDVPEFIIQRLYLIFTDLLDEANQSYLTECLYHIIDDSTNEYEIIFQGDWEEDEELHRVITEILDLLDGYVILYRERTPYEVSENYHTAEWEVSRISE